MSAFADPHLLVWGVAPLVLWLLGLALGRWRRKMLRRLASDPAHQGTALLRLLARTTARRRRWILGLQVLGLACVVVALAGPLIGARLVEFRQRGLDLFVAVDCSLSMQAQDFQPNRLAHARLVLNQLIDRLAGSRIGVIAFAGQAYVQCPLTLDHIAALDTLNMLEPGAVPKPGTRLGDAIRVAAHGMNAGEGGQRALVLLTDGEDRAEDADPEQAAREAAKAGLRIYTIGIGSVDGQPVPELDAEGRPAGLKRDKKGDVVLSRLDAKTLQAVAHAANGEYFAADPSGSEVEPLLRALEELQSGDRKTQLFNRFENRYQWPLALGVLLLLIGLAIPEVPRK